MQRHGYVAVCLLLALIATASAIDAHDAGIWIDVRTSSEYESGHLPGALNIDFDKIGDHISDIAPDKSAPIKLYCKSGRRSGFAKRTLERLGYTQVENAGGLRAVLRRHQRKPATGVD